jgi:hypothetical protein
MSIKKPVWTRCTVFTSYTRLSGSVSRPLMLFIRTRVLNCTYAYNRGLILRFSVSYPHLLLLMQVLICSCSSPRFSPFSLSRFLGLFQSMVFSPTFLGLTRFPSSLQGSLDRCATLIPLFQLFDLFSKNFACNLLVLRSGSGGLTFNNDACRFVDQLDGGIGFVLLIAGKVKGEKGRGKRRIC